MRKILIMVAVFGFAGSALAQTRTSLSEAKPAPTMSVPAQFGKLLQAYEGWTPEYKIEPYSGSVYNWATRALAYVEYNKVALTAARNWAFLRSDDSFNRLVQSQKQVLKKLFGDQYLARSMQIVAAVPFTAEINAAYLTWYGCMAKAPGWMDQAMGDDVLAYVNWKEENILLHCFSELGALGQMYRVAQLSADDLMAIGFLSRRHAANSLNPKFVSAEAIRKALFEAFEE
jgi:hypothetical protein